MVATAERPAPDVHRPLSKKVSVVGITLIILAGLLVFYLLHKVDWTDPPAYTGAIQSTNLESDAHNVKQTTYISRDILKKIELNLADDLTEKDWWSITQNLDHPTYVLYDESKTITFISSNFFHIECPAYYLSISYEALKDNLTLIIYTQTVGPCGTNFK